MGFYLKRLNGEFLPKLCLTVISFMFSINMKMLKWK